MSIRIRSMKLSTRNSRHWWRNEGRFNVARTQTTALRARAAGAAKSGKGPVRRGKTLTEQAYRLIEEQIVTLRLKPGDVLSEQMLSATFDIGRTPIREACSGWPARGSSRSCRVKEFWYRISIRAANCWCSKSAAR